MLAQEKVPLVIFFWDEVPDEWTSKLRAAGTKIWMQIGSVSEAKRAIAQGVDGLVVQGSAAGGHNRSSAELISLLPAVRDLDDDMLLIAAGGIADGRSAAAALALGADGVWVGTRLLASIDPLPIPSTNAVFWRLGSMTPSATMFSARSFPMRRFEVYATAWSRSGKAATTRRLTRTSHRRHCPSSARPILRPEGAYDTLLRLPADGEGQRRLRGDEFACGRVGGSNERVARS